MTRSRKRRFVPLAATLEARRLLSGTPTAAWLGQDGLDLAGGATAGTGNGIQDVHVALGGLPAGDPIQKIQMFGYGRGEWDLDVNTYSRYGGVLRQAPGATSADWYFDVYETETGRSFALTITYADQTTAVVNMNGGTADANLRTPAYALTAGWIGQDGHDLTGQSVGVGPDGYQDVHLTLGHIDASTSVTSVTVTDPQGDAWGAGTNPGGFYRAEFQANPGDATTGDLDFSPNRDLNGQTLTVTVHYANGSLDHAALAAGPTDPNLAMPARPAANVTWNAVGVRWLGQDGLDLLGPGDVHLGLSGLPAGRTVVGAALGDRSGVAWGYARPGSGFVTADPSAAGLGFRAGAGADPTAADLTFPPVVDETGATLTLLLTLDDGSVLAARVAGAACDPGLRAPGVAATSVVAHPGDDLNALANRYGTVRLVAGLYPLDAPLVLNHPVTLTADPGATLVFAQGANDPAWSAAIKVRSSHSTLDGFAVRFAGPVRWNTNVSYGPAVVGWSDNLDPTSGDPGLDLAFTRLDVQSPPAATAWEEAPRLFRLVGAESGRVSDNLMKGGTTELTGGPWNVTGNDYLGTMPGTFTYCVFGTHSTRALTLTGNTAEPAGAAGKTWRFLVMTRQGVNDVVAGNSVVGVGPMDTDTVPSPNASEIILTEAYSVHFEGLVSSVSADGLTVQIPSPQGGQARTGDAVAILSGPQAGQWRTVAQVISPTTYVLDSPVTPGRFAVSLETGFVNETYRGNTVDARGSSAAGDLVLVGNQFGVNVLGNTFLGGNVAFKITACPSESPNAWGWTHAPLLGATIRGNTFQDTLRGGFLDVEHNANAATDAGRVYLSGTFADNVGGWTAPFLAARGAAGISSPPTLVTVGDPLSADPGELILGASNNQVSGPAGVVSGQTFQVVSGLLNGQPVRNAGYVLPGVGSSPVLPTVQAAPSATPAPAPAVVPKAVFPVSAAQVPKAGAPAITVQAPKVPTPAHKVATPRVPPSRVIVTHPPRKAPAPVRRGEPAHPAYPTVHYGPGSFRLSGGFAGARWVSVR